jgi:hypothetical protein
MKNILVMNLYKVPYLTEKAPWRLKINTKSKLTYVCITTPGPDIRAEVLMQNCAIAFKNVVSSRSTRYAMLAK